MSPSALRDAASKGWIVASLILVFGCVLYANSLGNGYAIDDQLIIEDNPLTSRGVAAIPTILTTNYLYQEGRGASYRAVPRISYALEYEWFGAAPRVHHAVNALIHAIAGVVVWRWLALLFPAAPAGFAVLAALLFLAHPIHTEVVNNLKSRDELMSFLFGGLSVVAFLRYGTGGAWAWLLAGTLAFGLGLTSKESSQSFLAIVPLCMYFRSGFQGPARRRIVAAFGSLCLVTLAYWGFLYFFLNREYAAWMATATQDFPFVEHPLLFVEDLSTRLGTAFYSLGYYLRLFLWPHPLSFFYGYGAIPLVGLDNGFAIASFVVFLGIGFAALAALARPTIPGFAACYLLGTLAMFSNLVIPMSGIVGERFVFGASLAVCILAAWLLTRQRNWVAAVVGVAMLGALSATTIARNPAWKDRRTLAERDVQSFPDAAVIRALLFQLDFRDARETDSRLVRHQKVQDALGQLDEIERIYPPYAARVAFSRGQAAFYLLGDADGAIESFYRGLRILEEGTGAPFAERGITVQPFRIHLELARVFAQIDREADARIHLHEAVEGWNLVTDGALLDPRAIGALPLDQAITRVVATVGENS